MAHGKTTTGYQVLVTDLVMVGKAGLVEGNAVVGILDASIGQMLEAVAQIILAAFAPWPNSMA
jgi:hypothetical protein